MPVSISNPLEIKLDLVDSTPVSCYSGNDGSLLFSTKGGWKEPSEENPFNPVNWGPSYVYELAKDGVPLTNVPLRYAGYDDANIQTSWMAYFDNLEAGSYTIKVSEVIAANDRAPEDIEYACARILGPFIIGEPAAFELNASQSDVLCYGESSGELLIAPFGGTPDYAITWYKGNFADLDNPGGLSDKIKDETISAGGSSMLIELPIGQYAVLIRDANSCVNAYNFTILQPDELLFSVDEVMDVSCFGQATGEISIRVDQESVGGYSTALNGTDYTGQPVFFSSPFASTHTFAGLKAGIYEILVEDANSCQELIEQITVTQPDTELILEEGEVSAYGDNNISCYGASDGWITPEIRGGQGELKFDWSGPSGFSAATLDISDLFSGDYSLVVTDENGCTARFSYTLNQPKEIAVSGIISNFNTFGVSCQGASDGSITLDVLGGTAPYTFSWTTVDGSLAPAQMSQQNLTGLSAGTYEVEIRDSHGCISVETYVLTQPQALLLEEAVSVDVLCKGDASGSISVQIDQESVGPYVFSLYQGGIELTNLRTEQLGYVFENMVAGSYSVRVEDSNGCFEETSVNIAEADAEMEIIPKGLSAISCFGAADGTISIDVTGGGGPSNTPQYGFSWTLDGQPFISNASSTQRALSGLQPGSYQVTISDGVGCSVSSEEFVVVQPDELEVSGTPSNYNGFGIGRQGASDGHIALTMAGGTSPFQYSWTTVDGLIPSGMDNESYLNGLVAGTYSVVVIDGMGCTTSGEWTLIEPQELILAEPVLHNIACYGETSGRILLAIETASVPPFQYVISGTTYENIAFNQEIASPDVSFEFQGLFAGTYSVTVRDANGVEETLGDLVLLQPGTGMALIDEEVTSISCFGDGNGSISIGITGGGGLENTPVYSFAWNRGGQPYALQAGDAPNLLTNLNPGVYQVVVTDGHGCSISSEEYVIAQPGELRINGLLSDYSSFGVSCNGASDGAITLSLSGGMEPFSYSWSTSDGMLSEVQKSQKDLYGLAAGTYSVEVMDDNGCTESTFFTLTEPNQLELSLSDGVDVTCKGAASGSFKTTITQESVGPYTYALYADETVITTTTTADLSFTLDGLVAGIYMVRVEDGNGCIQESSNIEIIEPEARLEFSLQEKSNILCSGEADGAIDVEVIGGGGLENSQEYIFNWYFNGQPYAINSNSTNTALRDLAGGDYYLIVEDGFGCYIRSDTFTISQPIALEVAGTISTYNGVEISCHGGNDGVIALNVTGGSGVFEYSWSTSDGSIATGQESNRDITGLTAGTYTIQIVDENGCELSTTYTLREPDALILREDMSQRQNIVCFGEATGSIVAIASGGNAPYRFVVSGMTFEGNAVSFTSDFSTQNIFQFEGLQAGDYNVALVDQNGCSAFIEATISLSQPIAPLAITNEAVSNYNGFNVSCFGDNDAFIHLEVDGGVEPYTYSWTGPEGFKASSLNLDGVALGKYTFTLSDQNGCAVTRDFDMHGPNPIEVETLQQNVFCGGEGNGNIFIQHVKGGTGSYQFVWMKDGSGVISRTFQPSNLRNIGPGKYVLIVTDESNCEVIKTFTITESDPIVVQVTSKSNNACFEDNSGSIDVSIAGGTAPYTYFWKGPEGFENTSRNIQNLYAGEYTLNVTDAVQCVTTINVTVDEPEEILIEGTVSSITCYGENNGQINLDVSGGAGIYRYKWTGPDGFTSTNKNIRDLYAGDYLLQITDEINCTLERNFTVTEPGELKANPIISDYNGFEVSCKGGNTGSIDLQLSGGTGTYTVIWEGPEDFYSEAEKIEDLFPGEYEVFVKDERDCWFRTTYILREPDQLVIGEENLTPNMVSCYNGRDGSILVQLPNQSVGPYHYEINGQYLNGVFHEEAVQTADLFYEFAELRAGSYNVSVIDANGCHITEVTGVEISQPQAVLEAKVAVSDVQCYLANNGTVSIQAEGGTAPYTILWNNGSETWTLDNLAPGDYTAVVTDRNGCEASVTAAVQEAPVFTTNPEVSNISCKGMADGFIKLNIQGGTTLVRVKWDHGPQTPELFNLAAGTYSATIHDGNCEIREVIVVNEPNQLRITSSVIHAVNCENPDSGAVEVTPIGGTPPYTYEWSNGSNKRFVVDLGMGQYSVKVTDAMGCSVVEQMTVLGSEPIQAAVIQYPSKICEPRTMQTVFETVVSGGLPPYQISWNRGKSSNNGATMITQEEGLFTLTVTDQRGCQYVEVFSVSNEDDILLNFEYRSDSYGEFYENLANYDIHFTNNSVGEIREFGWNFGDGNISSERHPVHRYQKAGDYVVTLSMKDVDGCTTSIQQEIHVTDYFLVVPDIFTPNGDGLNDNFFPKFIHIENLELWVVNKWGENIYYTDKLDDSGWDGTFAGKDAPQGNYVYKLMFTTKDGRVLQRTGQIFLAR